MSDVEEKVIKMICEQLDVPEEDVVPKASFVDDLGADSLDQVELIMDFEDKFDMQIPEEEAEKIVTIGDAVQYVESHIGSE